MTAVLLSVFVASLVGSLHCAGMCGGIVALCVGVDGGRAPRRWPTHAAYHGGRLLTYAALGAVSGGLGAAVDISGSVLGVPRLAAVAAGGLMIVFGIAVLLRARGVRLGCMRMPRQLEEWFRRGLEAAHRRPPVARSLLVGLLTGFLPCGWLYAFVISAAGTGGAAAGAMLMAVFWAGTVPILLLLGLGLHRLAEPLRRHAPTLTALALVAVGVVTVFGRIGLPEYATAMAAGAPSSLEEVAGRVQSLDSASLPCHDEP